MEFFGFGIYELFLLFFVYVLGCIVISDQLRLRWWSSKGCNSNKNSQEANGPTNWVFWIAIVYITMITLYILYKLYKTIYDGDDAFNASLKFRKLKF